MDVDFQMVRSLIEHEKNERSRRRREGKNLDKCHFQKLDFEKKKKNVGSGSMCLVSFEREKKRERERERGDLFRTAAKLLSKVFFNEENSIDEPIHRNLCRALIEANKWKRRKDVRARTARTLHVRQSLLKTFRHRKVCFNEGKKCN